MRLHSFLPTFLLLSRALEVTAQRGRPSGSEDGGDKPLPEPNGENENGNGNGGVTEPQPVNVDTGGIYFRGGYESPRLPGPKDDDPHAEVVPEAHVALPKNPSHAQEEEEEEDSDLGEALKEVAELIEKIVDAVNDDSGSTNQTSNKRDILDDTANAWATATPITPPPAQATGCLLANDLYYTCAKTATTSVHFSSLLRTDQASCLCYGTASGTWFWQPSSFDNYMTSCASYAATQNISTSQASVRAEISSAAGLCGRAGDVRTTAVVVGSGNVTSTTTVTPTTSTTAASTSMSPIAPVKTGMAVRREVGMGMGVWMGLVGVVFLV